MKRFFSIYRSYRSFIAIHFKNQDVINVSHRLNIEYSLEIMYILNLNDFLEISVILCYNLKATGTDHNCEPLNIRYVIHKSYVNVRNLGQKV